MKEIKTLLFHLTELNIKLWIENGRLRYSAPKGALTQELRDKLVKNKADIIDFLSKTESSKHAFIQSDSPIKKISRNQDLPLSFAQQRLWFLDQLENSKSTTYNMPPTAIKLNGPLNEEILELSLNTIIERHEILRTHFRIEGDNTVQIISDQLNLKVRRIGLQKFNKDQQNKELKIITRNEAEQLFDLGKGPLIRAVLIALNKIGDKIGNKTEHVLIISMHHIVSDGWSTNIFVQELAQLYNAFLSGKASPLPPLEIQYADYAMWQRQKLSGEFLEKQKQYWKQKLSNAPALLELPIDYPRPPVQRFHGKTEYFYLSKEFTQQLNDFSKQYGLTLFMSLFASFATLLYRYTASEDILIGTPVANRNHHQIENLIGFFVNTVVLRIKFQESLSFEDLLEQVKKTALEAYDHQDIPFEQVVEELQVVRDLSYTPIFQVMFILLNTPFEEIELTDLTINLLPTENINAVYELIMVMEESSNGIEGKVRYNTDIFETSTIKRLIGHFTTLLKGIINKPEQTVLNLPLLTDEEIQQIQTWNKQPEKFPEDLCLHQLFENQVDQSPQAIALVFDDKQMTYQELNEKANQLAHFLQKMGVKPDSLVGICVDRSLEMVIGILGILKSGGAYLPIDPTSPDERVAFIFKDAAVDIVLSHSDFSDKFSAIQSQIFYLDQEDFQSMKIENPHSQVNKNNLAYVIYTSGSTGKPKGALITHYNVTRLFLATKSWYHFNKNDVWTLFHSYAFDFSVWEIWGALLYGGKLVIVPYWVSRSPDAFYDLLCKHKVTVLNQTPSAFNQLQKIEEQKGICEDLNLRYVIFGGEALEFQSLKPWFEGHGDRKPQLINMYGITETTVHVTYHPLKLNDLDKSKSLIGYPIPDLQAYILDNNLQHKPVGIPGELYIGGAGVARGYLNRPELTEEKFIANSFNDTFDTLYKTGDLARFLPDGSLEYLGRIDNQVKIRGFRIELGEIESVLVQHPLVLNSLVIGSKTADETGLRLLAYVVVGPDHKVTSSELRSFLIDKLPEYMIPSVYIMLESFPLTANGKIDRRALPEPDSMRPDLETNYVAPKTQTELLIANMWKEIIGLDEIGVNDNFFDLGGDSIKGAIFINKLQKQLNQIIYVVAIFEAPTIAEFINYLKKHYPDVVDSIDGQAQAKKHERIQKLNALDFIKFRKIIKPLPFRKITSKNPQAIFILSPPRSGSTLLRVLLGGHPLIFAPPELELLSFNTLQERAEAFTGRNSFWLEGTLRAMMGIKGYDAHQAKLEMSQYEKKNLTTQEMYEQMQTWLKDKILVDKTPSYALDINILQQAEHYFENPLYIHLLRHPYGMINSFEEAKLDQIFFLYEHNYSTRELAELTWLQSNVNILEFFEQIPSSRKHTVSFEDMTGKTETVIKEICEFIKLDFHPDMLKPYQEKQKRMTDGIYKESRMLGDVKFLDHKKIKSQISHRWKDNYKHDFLGDITWQIAELLGYENDFGLSHDNKTIEIKRIQRSDNLPISFAQQRLWFLDQYEEESTTYNISIALQLKGHLKTNVLKQSLQAILDRHESLQSTFHKENGIPVVRISKQALQFDSLDLRNLTDEERDIKAKSLIDEEFNLPFNLSQGPLFRSKLLQIDEDSNILLVSMHHIVSDGWSIGILIKDWTGLYTAFSKNQGSPLPKPLADLSIQYVDYANWQRQWLKGEEYNRQVNYWKNQLKGIPELLELPTDFIRPPAQTFKGISLHFSLSPELTQQIKKLSQKSNCTLFMTLISAFSILMAKYSGQKDIVLGSPIANRNHKDIESLIGFFVNTLILRFDLSSNPAFEDFLQQNRNVILDAYAHQDISFEQLVEELQPGRSLSHSPLFQVLFVLQNAPMGKLELPDLTISPINQDSEISKYDLSMILEENDDTSGIDGTVEFNTDLFKPETIERLIGHFKNILQEIVKAPDQSIYQYEIMSPSELQTILYQWNETDISYAKDKCIHELFEEQVEKTPDKIAIIFEDQAITYQITYRELNHKANILAHHLKSLNVKTEDLIGIYMERSLEMVIGLLGILKSGGAYVPLDPTYPVDRIQYMIENSETKILVTQSHLLENINLKNIHTICLDDQEFFQEGHQENSEKNPEKNLKQNSGPSNLAYVIFTSGSTGKPKGVMLSHQSVNNFINSMRIKPGLSQDDILMAVTTISFDIAVLELYLPLTTGAKIILASDEMTKDGSLLLENMKKYNVTVMQATPATWKLLLSVGWNGGWEAMDQLKILCGGEALPQKLASQLVEKGKEVWNLYGPTETTVWSSVCKVEKKDDQEIYDAPQSLGYPIANTQIYILDTFNQPVPIGVLGELHIGGDGLARGYLKRPGLTAEKFIKNPFIKDALMYKTGDLVRYLPDGNIEYSCRLDNQVKIRGYRIELGEIESLLSKHPTVKEAVVIVKPDQTGENSLVAYIIPQDEKIDSSELRSFLSQGLPVYMIPSIYISLDKMPLTPNGKINRLALPNPNLQLFNRGSSELIPPRDTLEIQLAQIWEKVLKVSPIGIRDNFFDLGGHSLMAVRLMAKIEEAFDKHLPLATLFKNGTIELLANHIRHNEDDNSSWSSIIPIQPEGSKTPFFCSPGAGGNVLYFQELAMNLGKERPFYALQPPGLDGKTPPLKNIEDLAKHYIKAIKTIQKTGPYYLGGHSFGGLVAFEMSQQLIKNNEEVALLAILDSPAPIYSQPTGEGWDEARWLTQIANIISHLYGKNLEITEDSFKSFAEDDEKLKFLHDKLKEYDFLPKEAKLSHFKGFIDVYKTNLLMTVNVNKDIYPVNPVLFRSTDRQPQELEHDNTEKIRDDYTLGWNQFLSKEIDVCMIPGDHLTMLTDPNVKELAKQINYK